MPAAKHIVSSIYKRNGKVYTKIEPDVQRTTPQNIIRGKVSLDSVIYSDFWRDYNRLIDVGYSRHLRINRLDDVFAVGDIHLNDIERFRSFAKRRLQKFNGVPAPLSICI